LFTHPDDLRMTIHHTVRRAIPDDARAVHAMVLEIADHEGDGHHVRVTADQWRELLARPDVVVHLAETRTEAGPEAAPEAVGYASATRQLHLWSGRDILALDDLYVREAFRGHGVGATLMRAVAEYAAPESLLVRWTLYETNEGARRFYERIGATVHSKLIAAWRPHDYTAWARVSALSEVRS